ncbi:MAG TPA: peptidase M28 family protein [Solibacterales bacterium]|nr:peptidase M28 family protein [Bryobacterales bacterium]
MFKPLVAVLLTTALSAETLSETYREPASRLLGAALTDDEGWSKLEYLCDRIGHRLSGSAAYERAVRWAAETLRRDGLAVQTPPVKIPVWVRGAESAEILEPEPRKLAMLGLGGSVGTPPDGIVAEVVAVSSFEQLEALGRERVQGRIVLYNVPFTGYGRVVMFRSAGASRAAGFGAVGMLLRSLGPVSLQTPHTGMLSYDPAQPKIPAAGITLEAATMIQRLIDNGNTVRVRLKMEARTLPDADSAQVVGEIRGAEKPEEIVVLGGHLDSWDVGQGAQDDGSGSVAAMQAVALIKKLGLKPRRTIRVVLFANEENGLAGAQAYKDWVGEAVKRHVAAIEMDGGAERPAGFGLGIAASAQGRAMERLRQIGRLLDGIGAGQMTVGGGGADIGPIMREGVPGLGLRTSGGRYMEWHHTEADTLDKIDKQDFRQCVAALAVMAYVLADMPERLAD